MVSIEDAIVARLETQGEKFEILIHPKAAMDIKLGKEVNLEENLVIDDIFKDAKKGDRASEEKMQKVFGTTNVLEIAKQIILKGEVHLTAEQRKELQETKRKQIITMIARNAINPQTRTPHPPARIELAMEEAKVRIDPFKPVEVQVKEVLNALKPILPIRFEKVQIAIRVPGEEYGRIYSDIKAFGEIKKEEWQKNGSWIGVVELPAGMQTDFLERLNERTKGNIETRILK